MIKFFKELITDDESSEIVVNGQNVILDGGTGTGKSSWVIDVLSKHSNRILYLVPRQKLKEDITQDISMKRISNISVITYQSIEYYIQKKFYSDYDMAEDAIIGKWLCVYDAVVFDEIHCIITDSSYNQYTEYIYKLMFRLLQTEIAVIMMSATGDAVFNNIKDIYVNPDHVYSIISDYSYLYCTPVKSSSTGINNTIKELINTSTPEEKIIYFCSNKSRGIDYYYEFQQICDTIFACSKFDETERATKINKINSITDTFPGKLLISTTALDVGINLKDTNIRYIVTDMYDVDSIIQCLGRRRVKPKSERNGEGDPVYFYFRNWNKNDIQFIKRNIDKELHQIDLFKNDIDKFNSTFFKKDTEKSKFIYYDKNRWKLNDVGEIKLMSDSHKVHEIATYTLKNILGSRLIGAKIYEVEDYEEKHETIRSFVLSKLNVPLDAAERESLIDVIDLRDKRKRKQRSFKMIATYLDEHCQVSLETERVQNDGIRETYWIIKPTEKTYDFINKYYRR